ncbi:uncharacterized protein LOC128951323 [Oppia nitens]|uniref:uncharacterized protein LOC128951323 n=1 Tax=Oppia nitens TaxID=1686743 RepID=UPI0023DA2E3F|nr:uncharacterized protein LOC128951323 [Oppia nitens]
MNFMHELLFVVILFIAAIKTASVVKHSTQLDDNITKEQLIVNITDQLNKTEIVLNDLKARGYQQFVKQLDTYVNKMVVQKQIVIKADPTTFEGQVLIDMAAIALDKYVSDIGVIIVASNTQIGADNRVIVKNISNAATGYYSDFYTLANTRLTKYKDIELSKLNTNILENILNNTLTEKAIAKQLLIDWPSK